MKITRTKNYELRGLTFVEQPDGTWERNLLMNKFFNVNQTVGWMEEDIKDKKIVRVQDKLDGSVISFVKFPNGTVRAKSKMSFNSEQAVMAQKLYDENENLRNMLEYSFSIDHTLIFELVSPENQIVLEYQDTKLVLLQARDNTTGSYLLDTLDWFSNTYEIECSLKYKGNYSNLDRLLELKTTEEGIEGWIVTFEDGQMAKIKTDWYLQLHGLIGPDAFRENLLVKTILDGNIDDVISNLVPGVKKDKIVELSEKVEHQFNHLVVEYKRLRGEYFNKYEENRKEFAMKYSRSHELFGAVMKGLNTSFRDVEKTAESAVKAYMLKRCKSLGDAREYVGSL